MSDERTSATERAEAAAIRRRWITLGELVAIAGLMISALALWNSYADRRADQAEQRREKASETRARKLVLLTATPGHGGEQLALKDAAHPVQSIDIRFPADLGTPAQSALLEPRIEAAWFARELLKRTDKGPDAQQGRLPVLITASYWDADRQRHDSAIYDIVWRTEGRFLRGRTLRLEGLMLRDRTASAARLEAAWAAARPGKG